MEPNGGRGATANRRRFHSAYRHTFDEGVRDLDYEPLSPTQEREAMTRIYAARWVLPVSSAPIEHGAVAVDGSSIVGVGSATEITSRFPGAQIESFGESAILPGLINTHTHLELTALRGYLENEEHDFFAWLRKLTLARLERMTPDDIRVSATWGACEAVRAGITCVGDASDSAAMSMLALQDVGLRGVVFQESFGPDPRLVEENFGKLTAKIAELRELE